MMASHLFGACVHLRAVRMGKQLRSEAEKVLGDQA